jgi:hypothetical protein
MRARQARQPKGRQEWMAIARARILRGLRRRIAATSSQLEVKVCECGPAYLRPDPHILTEALAELVGAGRIQPVWVHEHNLTLPCFYTLPQFSPRPALDRIHALLPAYRCYRMLTDTEAYCSRALEQIVRASFEAAGGYDPTPERLAESGLDGVYEHGANLLGVEVKNARAWLYPSSGRIWVTIAKCLNIHALPVLVSRKVHYVTHRLFQMLGIVSFQIHRQVFAPEIAPLLVDVQHTHMLGFKDVVALPPTPYEPLVRFLSKIPMHFDDYRARWDRQRDLLTEFAVARGLGDPAMPDRERRRHWPEFGRLVLKNSEQIEALIETPLPMEDTR